MKSISLALAALFCASSPLAVVSPVQSTQVAQNQETNLSSSVQFVEFVRSEYKEGKYNKFLESMDKDYEQAKKDGALEGLIEMRKEDAKILAANSQVPNEWNKMSQNWAAERDKDLLKLIDKQDNSEIAQKIRSIAQPVDSTVRETILYFLNLSNLAPGEGKNADENLLIERDVEREYKEGHLNASMVLENWTPDAQEKHFAIRIQMMDKILKDSENFQDKDLKKKVETFAAALDTYQIKRLDLKQLHQLANGTIKPSNDLEKGAAAILSAYEGKYSNLTKDILQQTQNN